MDVHLNEQSQKIWKYRIFFVSVAIFNDANAIPENDVRSRVGTCKN